MRTRIIPLLLLSFLAARVGAQESGALPEDADPAVDTSATLPADAAENETPAVPSSDEATRVTASDGVMDQLDLERTEITGNQELPKVLYIVPWQKSDPGDLMGRPVNTLLDEVLAPIDRGEFVRQVRYYEDLQDD